MVRSAVGAQICIRHGFMSIGFAPKRNKNSVVRNKCLLRNLTWNGFREILPVFQGVAAPPVADDPACAPSLIPFASVRFCWYAYCGPIIPLCGNKNRIPVIKVVDCKYALWY